jgi:glycosyltransferase involved in cell wall biosynthesis
LVKSAIEDSEGGDTPPLLTVAMPIYNAGHHLRIAVLSIVHQSFNDWELLIFDDGSTDNSVRSLDDINDPRIRIINDGLNKGLAARLNEAIDMARGQYFARMDQDDVSYPERFAKQLSLLNSNSALDVVAASAITIFEDNEMVGLLPCPVSHDSICARPWRGFCFAHPTWMGKTVWFKKFRYAIPGAYFCEDQEMLLRSYSESRFGATAEILFAYRIREKRNLPRVLKTRWAFFTIQVVHFMRARQFIATTFSGLACLALVARDVWWEFHQKTNSSKRSSSIAFSAEVLKWQKVLDEVLEERKDALI